MVETMTLGRIWNGVHFYCSGDLPFAHKPASYAFCRHSDGVQMTFDEGEWMTLQSVICFGLMDPRLQSMLTELSLIYGEL